jgi:CheY-like chemotaxis protein
MGDPGRLRQILLNLVGNAVKFTGQGEIRTRVWLESEPAGRVELHFMVADTGIGIPQERQAAVFARFEQASVHTSRKYGGTGLGLTISSQLVGLMGGRVWVESPWKDGERMVPGSAFHFTARFGVGGGGEPADGTASLMGVPVLVADDHEPNRSSLSAVLRGWGMIPTCVEDGPSAIEALQRAAAKGDPFPLAALDFDMPGLSGCEVGEMVRRTAGTDKTKIILLTSAGRREELARGGRSSIDARLLKPVKQSELLSIILSLLSEQGAGPSDEEARSERPLRILIAEDNAVNRRVASRLLEKRGHTALTAANGAEALEALAQHQFDLILMDVQMPVMDGIEATEALRRKEMGSGRRLPVIAMTALAMDGDRDRCRAAGMDGYLSKPIQPEELYKALAEVAAGRGNAPAVPTA